MVVTFFLWWPYQMLHVFNSKYLNFTHLQSECVWIIASQFVTTILLECWKLAHFVVLVPRHGNRGSFQFSFTILSRFQETICGAQSFTTDKFLRVRRSTNPFFCKSRFLQFVMENRNFIRFIFQPITFISKAFSQNRYIPTQWYSIYIKYFISEISSKM